MRRILIFSLLAMFAFAFSGTGMACPVEGWDIKRTGGIKHRYLYVDNVYKDVKYTTYTAHYHEGSCLTPKETYQAWALTPSADQNLKKDYSPMAAETYFGTRTQELEAITRFFQISHFTQPGSSTANIEQELYREFLHLAIWEIMIDGMDNFDLFSGNMKMKDICINDNDWLLATQNHYLSLFYEPGYEEHLYTFTVLVKDGHVDPAGFLKADFLIFEYQNSPPPPVPVPGAVWLMGTGVAGLAALRRKRRK